MTRMNLTALLAAALFGLAIGTVTLVMIPGDSPKGKAAGSTKAAGRRIRGLSAPGSRIHKHSGRGERCRTNRRRRPTFASWPRR